MERGIRKGEMETKDIKKTIKMYRLAEELEKEIVTELAEMDVDGIVLAGIQILGSKNTKVKKLIRFINSM